MSIEELYDGTGHEKLLTPTIDIVAVHGLNPTNSANHAVATWQDSKTGHLWLRDALPLAKPSVRTLLYSYNSSPVFENDKEHFVYQANSLLECLRIDRKKEPKRPLIIIGHSLGGILIKQALVNAQNNPKYKDIKEATFGLVFFGTPHAGPTNDLKVKFGRACVAIAQSMPWKVSNDLMKALEKGSLFSDVLYENWRHQLEQYHFVSLYEGLGTLVPKESAVFGLAGDRENQVRLNATHSNMCRFNPSVKADMDNYFFVKANIEDLCDLCPASNADAEILEKLMESLRSLSLNPRLDKISDKHRESFQWIWKDGEDGPHFVKWLKSDDLIYWITGLPGSGKSTMMKYLYEDPQSESLTDKRSITKIGYFFHELGTTRETTFMGLLASILRQLLASFESIALPCVKLFIELQKKQEKLSQSSPWTERNLKNALELVRQSEVTGTVLLFIDGLDECSGDHRQQLEFLIPWIQSMQGQKLLIRMCLASRPLEEIKFRLSAFSECRIHEWTANDISEYVHDRLGHTWNVLPEGNRGQYRRTDDKYLTEEILKKARGVFLWVELVVNNLIIGLEEGSTDLELRESLDSLPLQLEELYRGLIKQIPKLFLSEAKKYIRLTLQNPMGLLEFHLATREPDLVLTRTSESSYEDHLAIRDACNMTETRIRSRCRGLLQVNQANKHNLRGRRAEETETDPYVEDFPEVLESILGKKVQFLHLSVKEYLISTGVEEHEKSIDIREALMASSLGVLKLLRPHQLLKFWVWEPGESDRSPSPSDRSSSPSSQPSPSGPPSPSGQPSPSGRSSSSRSSIPDGSLLMEYTRDDPDTDEVYFVGYRPIRNFFENIWIPRKSPNCRGRRLLAELDRICTLASKTWYTPYLDSILRAYGDDANMLLDHEDTKSWNIDLFCLCLSHGSCLDVYVQEEIENSCYSLEKRTGRPILRFYFDSYLINIDIRGEDICRLLLKHGAQPNEIYGGQTTWEYALKATNFCEIFNVYWPQEGWALPLLLLVEHGADPNHVGMYGNLPLYIVNGLFRRDAKNTWDEDASKDLVKALVAHGGRLPDEDLHGTHGFVRKLIQKTIRDTEGSFSNTST